jgi:hypothetical protein
MMVDDIMELESSQDQFADQFPAQPQSSVDLSSLPKLDKQRQSEFRFTEILKEIPNFITD